jgi:RNA polymerase sigma-70 factor (ECF subfamily)
VVIDPDAALMSRLSAGDDLALNELMQRWQSPLLSFLLRYTGSRDDALDLAQETFVRAYENRHRYQPRAKFASWLFTIASNLARNHARWRKRHPTVPLDAPADGEGKGESAALAVASAEPTPADSAEREDLASAVREHIGRLPHDLRTAVLLFEYDELSHAEIAGALGCTPKAVESRLYRARELLHKALSAWRIKPLPAARAKAPGAPTALAAAS